MEDLNLPSYMQHRDSVGAAVEYNDDEIIAEVDGGKQHNSKGIANETAISIFSQVCGRGERV